MQNDRFTPLLCQNLLDTRGDKRIELVREWISKHGMNHHTLSSEERIVSDPLCSVDDLIRNDEMSRSDFLSQRSNGRKGDDGLDT